MVNSIREIPEDLHINGPLQKQCKDIQEQGHLILILLTLILFFLQVVFFLDLWITFTTETLDSRMYDFVIANLFLIIIIVGYYWAILDRPQFNILFIGSLENGQKYIERKPLFLQIFKFQNSEKESASSLLIILVAISIGLGISNLLVWSSGLYEILKPFNPYYYPPILPLIIILISILVFFALYRKYSEHMTRWLPKILYIPAACVAIVSAFQLGFNLKYAILFGSTLSDPTGLLFYSSRIIWLASIIVFLYFLYRYHDAYWDIYTQVKGRNLQGLIEKGMEILPKRIRLGESHNIALDLKLSEEFMKRSNHKEDLSKNNDYLEIELLAAGLKIEGEKRVVVSETSPLSTIIWNCNFPTAGIQSINLLINTVRPSDNKRNIVFSQKLDIKVDNFWSVVWQPVIFFVVPILLTLPELFKVVPK